MSLSGFPPARVILQGRCEIIAKKKKKRCFKYAAPVWRNFKDGGFGGACVVTKSRGGRTFQGELGRYSVAAGTFGTQRRQTSSTAQQISQIR
ncbi:hypothetical protein E2C01_019200 [Portunus trituberculatus]|uniref:Uncharacterized protein n=1 Tax=Portunus trituberculatus TaxID=210409 RepID=A0A5B7DY76_PORTR|nr:hypothetical protein [Portunus trituberculatus]